MVNLVEGLKEGDLEELLIPMISIDEYESKLDDDSIVVAFYVRDRDPSYDLNRFIQKGASAILDTDVSPDSYGRQQWGILDNGRKPDPAMPRV